MTKKKLIINLPDVEATLRLGSTLADFFQKKQEFLPIFLNGDLGAGKTTFVRAFVESLPGAENAEVSSPSFNILNIYPTKPQIEHFDLYRLEGQCPDDEFFDLLNNKKTLTVVEWIQYLNIEFWPDNALLFTWKTTSTGRKIELTFHGFATPLFEEIATLLESF
ncbi:tRNA (adenosine(37)-N6)-threonylcarbamoyltransferase complex ATPase subunit type 1 TsaE [Desulfovibrio sp. UCD-KL4C]|uniref:tRNA (adenosine(37)-N6)-threonylcarbamoyltransferase complex ATPase subunit type 1 TsaE n=1 Tax=Desulfovibrio sp. UCD-KL4C TaxID=2578120 RepID=UPI0025BE0B3A|nr:tRNA (adenosine(37)-N6)-threonylcarbamoyltransferase complex ATPase subunit type 1 TsaE [Desulfovibrio sp. UCD-KL4C]